MRPMILWLCFQSLCCQNSFYLIKHGEMLPDFFWKCFRKHLAWPEEMEFASRSSEEHPEQLSLGCISWSLSSCLEKQTFSQVIMKQMSNERSLYTFLISAAIQRLKVWHCRFYNLQWRNSVNNFYSMLQIIQWDILIEPKSMTFFFSVF